MNRVASQATVICPWLPSRCPLCRRAVSQTEVAGVLAVYCPACQDPARWSMPDPVYRAGVVVAVPGDDPAGDLVQRRVIGQVALRAMNHRPVYVMRLEGDSVPWRLEAELMWWNDHPAASPCAREFALGGGARAAAGIVRPAGLIRLSVVCLGDGAPGEAERRAWQRAAAATGRTPQRLASGGARIATLAIGEPVVPVSPCWEPSGWLPTSRRELVTPSGGIA